MIRLLTLTVLIVAGPVFAQLPGMPSNTVSDTGTSDDAAAVPQESPIDETVDQTTSLIDRISFSTLWSDNDWTDWLILLGGILAGLVVGKILSVTLRKVGDKLIERDAKLRGHLIGDLAGPASLALLTVGIWGGLMRLTMGDALHTFCIKTLTTMVTVAVFWYLYNLISLVEVWLERLTAKTESSLDDQLVPLVRKALRIFLVIIAVLFILDSIFDADIGAWLAGLGIVGLAVSLAAQDSLKNLFGSVTIFLDRPFLVGDFISYADKVGTVEEIGFRSTRVRTLDGHLMTVPNSNIVNDPVTNIGDRPYIRRVLNITITYDTPPDKIREAVQIVKDILDTEGIKEAVWAQDVEDPHDSSNFPPRVYFNDFNAASLNIVVYYWHRPPVWWDYLDHADRFNQMLFEKYGEAGIDFAFPTQTVYLAGDDKRELGIKLIDDGKD